MITHNRVLRRRRYWFFLTLFIPCMLLFLVLPWPAALTLLTLLAIFLAGAVEELWKLFQRWPTSPEPTTPQSSQPEEEYSSYTQGYQPQPVYYQEAAHQEEEDVPQAIYPEQQYR